MKYIDEDTGKPLSANKIISRLEYENNHLSQEVDILTKLLKKYEIGLTTKYNKG